MWGECPRCGLPVNWVERKRVGRRSYLYAVHYMGVEGGRRRIRKCYLGPEDSYEYVSRLHSREGLVLRGVWDEDRILEYLDTIARYLKENPNPRIIGRMLDIVSDVVKRIIDDAAQTT